MNALIRTAQSAEGRVKVEGGEFGQTFQFDDVDAAKALVATGIKVRGMLGGRSTKGEREPGEDLFDRIATCWTFPVQK